jgi:hypothetical protein
MVAPIGALGRAARRRSACDTAAERSVAHRQRRPIIVDDQLPTQLQVDARR